MKLYHGTAKSLADKIEKEGLIAWEFLPGIGYVYMTTDLELANQFGRAVFEIESNDLDQEKLGTYREGIGLVHNYKGNIPPNLIKRII